MADPIFADPRLAAIYDALDADRSDLDAYAAVVDDAAQEHSPACWLAGGFGRSALTPLAHPLTSLVPSRARIWCSGFWVTRPGCHRYRWTW